VSLLITLGTMLVGAWEDVVPWGGRVPGVMPGTLAWRASGRPGISPAAGFVPVVDLMSLLRLGSPSFVPVYGRLGVSIPRQPMEAPLMHVL